MTDDDDLHDSIDAKHVRRYIEALVLGQEADRVFRAECYKRGLDPAECYHAPLTWLAAVNNVHKSEIH